VGGVSVAVSQTARLARTLTSIPDSLLDRRGRRRRSHSLHPCSLTVPDSLSPSLSLPDTSLICRCVGGHVVHRGSRRYGPIEHCQRAATAASCRGPRACFSSLNCCLLPTTELGRTWSTRLTRIDINCRLLSQTGAVQLRTARDTADAASMSVRLLQRNGNYVRRSCSQEMISLTEY